jgi:hypothetical protein
VDRFEGLAWLDWWANSATNFGGIEVSVVITVAETGWEAHGRLNEDADREGFEFLCDFEPLFTLRFAEDATIDMIVHPSDDHRQFTMTEYDGPAERHVEYRVDL